MTSLLLVKLELIVIGLFISALVVNIAYVEPTAKPINPIDITAIK